MTRPAGSAPTAAPAAAPATTAAQPAPEEEAAYRETVRRLVAGCLQRLAATRVRDDALPLLHWMPGHE